MPRRPKVVDLQTRLEAPPPGLRELLEKLPPSPKERRSSVKMLGGVAAVRRGLLAILAGCARDDFGFDETVFHAACALLETVGPGKDRRFLALARSDRFDPDRASRLLRAATKGQDPDERGSVDVLEFIRKILPDLRDCLLLPGAEATFTESARQHDGIGLALEFARSEVGIPVEAVWEPVLRDPEVKPHVREWVTEVLAVENTPASRALLAEFLPTLPPERRRRALASLNGHTIPEDLPPPGGEDGSFTLVRPKLRFTLPDAHGDVVVYSAEDGLDGATTFAWLVVRLGAGVRRGGVKTNLSMSACSEAMHDAIGGAPERPVQPDIATLATMVDEALAARPGARYGHQTHLALQLVQREIAYGRQEARQREPFASALPAFESADLATWRRLLGYSGLVHSWFLDDGDLAALGVDRPEVDGLERRIAPADVPREERSAWYDAADAQRHARVPESWVKDVLRRVPGTPLLSRLERSLRQAGRVHGLFGRTGAPELLGRTADAMRDQGAAHPIVRAWVERSLFPDLQDDVMLVESRAWESDLSPLVDDLAAEAKDRRGLKERRERARKRATEVLARAGETRFAEERPTWDEAVIEAWEAARG